MRDLLKDHSGLDTVNTSTPASLSPPWLAFRVCRAIIRVPGGLKEIWKLIACRWWVTCRSTRFLLLHVHLTLPNCDFLIAVAHV